MLSETRSPVFIKMPKLIGFDKARLVSCFLLLFGLGCLQELKAQSLWEYQQEVFAFRSKQDSSLLHGTHSPLLSEDKKNYAGLTYFTINPAFKVSATWVSDKERSKSQLIADEASGLIKFGEVHFQLHGEPFKLGVFKQAEKQKGLLYQDSLIIPFYDGTSGGETAVVGRFLNVAAPQEGDASLWLDFNKAYNQPCVYNMAYTCLTTPEENTVPILIEAGEKTFLKPKDKGTLPVEVMPEFPGGTFAMFAYMAKKFKMPKDVSKSQGVNGAVVVSFIITTEGKVTDVEIVRPLYPSIDAEVIRVIQKMPKWKPGTVNNVPAAVKYTIPYRIVIK